MVISLIDKMVFRISLEKSVIVAISETFYE